MNTKLADIWNMQTPQRCSGADPRELEAGAVRQKGEERRKEDKWRLVFGGRGGVGRRCWENSMGGPMTKDECWET